MNEEIIGWREAGLIINHEGHTERYIEAVRPVKGFGRWIYCKYCYKSVKPMLSGINQIVCPECGYGLTPDFFSLENLKRWFSGDDSAMHDDGNSPEAKAWLEKKIREK